MRFRTRKKLTIKNSIFAAASLFLLAGLAAVIWFWWPSESIKPLRFVSTIAGTNGEFGEPFGIVVSGEKIYVSDGLNGKIFVLSNDGRVLSEEGGLDTPSGIAFGIDGHLVVADSGRNVIYRLDPSPTTIAGVSDKRGFADGDSSTALFNGPTGIAVANDGKIFVADTYNDRIRVIENGQVSTLAGSSKGYADGVAADAKFHTPCGLAIWHDKLLVADTGNRRIRIIEPDGRVWTLAGNGDLALKDDLISSSSFVQPTAIVVDKNGLIFVADGNAIRQIGGGAFPFVRTISNESCKW